MTIAQLNTLLSTILNGVVDALRGVTVMRVEGIGTINLLQLFISGFIVAYLRHVASKVMGQPPDGANLTRVARASSREARREAKRASKEVTGA